jgi:hypothetical protein
LKGKLILLLFVDTAARPSDLTKVYRILEGRFAQIRFEGRDMRIRYFWSKEVDPGSSRSNSTNEFFSKWVLVRGTKPESINTVQVMHDFLERSSDPDLFATEYIGQLGGDFQPLFYARKRGGKFQPSSSDHLSNVAQSAIDRVEMNLMQTTHLRGASTSKIVQLVPEMREEALALGRWTSDLAFSNHYQAEVKGKWDPVPAATKKSCQQILRHGFSERPPPGVSVKEYLAKPDSWVGKTIAGVGRISRFDDGSYWVDGAEMFHWDLMESISKGRAKLI